MGRSTQVLLVLVLIPYLVAVGIDAAFALPWQVLASISSLMLVSLAVAAITGWRRDPADPTTLPVITRPVKKR